MSDAGLTESWEEFCDSLRDAGRKVLDAAPDDDFDRAEGLRYVTRLAAQLLAGQPWRKPIRPGPSSTSRE